ncbi:N-acetylglucosamine kinase [Labedella phragmitis]|uniref:N-acetylglucosamine kinase n=1 Tax=Labedella phragmitis TaxID=2498849 RepID=A0A444PU76_9MICO|nr:BadF/BadG/BcrA/BcrD ATPase family protein [Labedella phragmitis]RWZ51436.1 N-acetylglucosamine kinase [Labedella phragmitis]
MTAGSGDVDAVLAFDGGGSKTDVMIVGLDGSPLAHVRGARSSPQTLGWDVARPVLQRLRDDVIAAAPQARIVATHVYLAGLDLPVELDEARTALAHWSPDVVDNDLFALLRAGTSDRDAVAVVCGTGINAIGVRADGAVARYPALGAISGDWGGGSFLGREALWHAARAEDARGPETELRSAVPAALGLSSVFEVIEAIHVGRLGHDTFAQLCPVLFDVAARGDAIAISVVDRQAEEVAVMATTAMRRLDLLTSAVPVVLGGGVLASRDERLVGGASARIAREAPLARVSVVTTPPILGAALRALESAGATATALERFSEAVSGRRWERAGV